jgi:hypothetical protein
MWPFHADVQDRVDNIMRSLEDKSIFMGSEGEPFLKVYNLLKEKGLTVV